ncbi:MAG: glutamyl-tRNA reductase [Proteobacteria bacterium]|nr:glutamyl-tRNA reductase [Pseudomonadota bacterium]
MPAGTRALAFVAGANHRSSTVGLRDRLFVDEAKAPLVFEQLARTGIAQAIVMSTCDRVEVQSVVTDADAARDTVRALLARNAGLAESDLADQVYNLSGDAAVRHIFAVAASLDSQTIGEPQVLGQVREAHRFSQAHGMIGPELDAILQAAYTTAKRVRTETEIGRRPVSIASAAGRIARDVQGDLSASAVLVIGLGDMADIVVNQFRAMGVTRIMQCGPSRRTEAAARRSGFHFIPYEMLDDSLSDAEIVVTAAGTGQFLVGEDSMRHALRRRRFRPVLLIDAGVPGDVDPAVGDLDGAFLYTLDDLERVAMEGRSTRGAASTAAWDIVDQEVESWRRAHAGRDAAPAIVALRDHFEVLRREILAETPDADAAETTRRLIGRLLHEPSRVMRELASARGGETDLQSVEQMLRLIFRLDDRDDGKQD